MDRGLRMHGRPIDGRFRTSRCVGHSAPPETLNGGRPEPAQPTIASISAKQLRVLRQAYHRAIAKHAEAAEILAQHACEGVEPNPIQIRREEEARLAVDIARSRYFDAWMLP